MGHGAYHPPRSAKGGSFAKFLWSRDDGPSGPAFALPSPMLDRSTLRTHVLRAVRRSAAAALVAAALVVPAVPASAGERILLVGNSFTTGIKQRLRSVARSAGHDASIKVRAMNGWTLADHAASAKTLRTIQATDWMTVVLQEQSLGIFASRYPAARALDAEIARTGARTTFFMTWRDRDASLLFWDPLLGVVGGDYGYVPITFELGAALAPVGWAFREAMLEDATLDLWGLDGHHSSERGRYLAALVLFATIYGESPVGLWASPALTPEEALRDQLLVERLVFSDPARWNL
jgi:hypothetical protein